MAIKAYEKTILQGVKPEFFEEKAEAIGLAYEDLGYISGGEILINFAWIEAAEDQNNYLIKELLDIKKDYPQYDEIILV